MVRANVTIVGCGERKSGNGKKGPYDFVPVAFTYEDKYMEGVNVGTANLDGAVFEQYGVRPGVSLEVFLYFKDYRANIAAVL